MNALVVKVIVIVAMAVSTFLVVWGAVTNKPELVAAGMTVIGGAIGSVTTYFFTKGTIERLRRILRQHNISEKEEK